MTKKQAKQLTQEFPDVLYVVRESDVDSVWFLASEDTAGIDNGTVVAVYERRTVKTVKVTRELE